MFAKANVDVHATKRGIITASSFTRSLDTHKAAGRIRDYRLVAGYGWWIEFNNGSSGCVRSGREAWWVAQALASAALAKPVIPVICDDTFVCETCGAERASGEYVAHMQTHML